MLRAMSEQEARDFLAALGGEIASWRRHRHISRERLGEMVGLSPSTLGRLERGEGVAAAATTDIWRIAQALNVPYSTLIRRAEEAASLNGDADDPTVV